jgi:hypothetical protein
MKTVTNKPEPIVFTPETTGVSQILDELIESLQTTDNLQLKEPKLKHKNKDEEKN